MAGPSSSGIGGRLGRKVGPLPVWAWAVLLAGVAYYFYRRNAGSSGSTSASQSAAQPVTDTTTGTGTDTTGSSGTSTSTVPLETITNNYYTVRKVVRTSPKLHKHTFPPKHKPPARKKAKK